MPATLHLDAANPADLARAADLLRSGHLVAFATETVYGLGANALDPVAVASVFAAKQRPAWDPLIVHLASAAQLPQVVDLGDDAELRRRIGKLALSFWPGPLTLLLPRTAAVPDAVTAGRSLVGVRIPAHAAAQALLREAGIPVAAPSANRFGHTSPTTAAHVLDDLEGRIDAVFDAGATEIGVESTVLDPTQTPMVLYRPGAVTAAQLTTATGVEVEVFVPPTMTTAPSALPSPGVGIRHYAPRARLVLLEPASNREQAFVERCNVEVQRGNRVGLLLPQGWSAPQEAVIAAWGNWHNPEELAHNLFAALRSLDDQAVDLILAPLPPAGGICDALRDRMQKAARSE